MKKSFGGSRGHKDAGDKSVWEKMFTPNASWEDKDQFLDVIYWGRQVLGILMGFLWGFFGITGFLGISMFLALNSAAVYLYSVKFNNDCDDIMEYVKEGLMTSFAGFLVTWIMIYSAIYH
ncbi:GEL complex subunit OPTI [Brevipalpus obovatus]|uniref:GEL complex subunit OPTI n=1 Tax=Brevipalpus obovatus TaxID=246614 RepID=UPI003D9EB3B7